MSISPTCSQNLDISRFAVIESILLVSAGANVRYKFCFRELFDEQNPKVRSIHNSGLKLSLGVRDHCLKVGTYPPHFE